MIKERVFLAGASGTMGYQAFLLLWEMRHAYDLVILSRPSKKNKTLFRPFEKKAGIESIPGKGIVEKNGFKIVWGDATDYADVKACVQGIDWVLDAMAFISPTADYYPELARAVNAEGVRNIVRAIEEEPDGTDHIRLIYTGTVAETGDRQGSIHWGRVGDPLKPSIFDFYAVSKIEGERAVLESNIRKWASLRCTFIMPVTKEEINGGTDPIMFHQPIDSFMENCTARDAGRGLVNALKVPDDSDFWRRCYNMGAGPECRCTNYELLERSMKINGLSGVAAVTERKWFALRNFHMQFYHDSHECNRYLNYWNDSMEDWFGMVKAARPLSMKIVAGLCAKFPSFRRKIEKATYDVFKKVCHEHKNGTMHWYTHRNDKRITAFYKDYETLEGIPDWGVDMPPLEDYPCVKLNHGYDETKSRLELSDLQGAAAFRGGRCLSKGWNEDMFSPVEWECALGHRFTARPNTVLKAGHWCPECEAPSWDYDHVAKRNPFFAQVWYSGHGEDESNTYTREDCDDIKAADREWAAVK